MIRFYFGLGLLVLSIVLFVGVIFYDWMSLHPDISSDGYNYYQQLSAILGISLIGALAFGVYLVVTAVRRLNREDQARLDE